MITIIVIIYCFSPKTKSLDTNDDKKGGNTHEETKTNTTKSEDIYIKDEIKTTNIPSAKSSSETDKKDEENNKNTKARTEENYKIIKNCTITAYCGCKSCSGKWGNLTSTGKTCTANRTVAVDPTVIPLGSKLEVNGKTYIAEDTGSAVKGNHVDIYFSTHSETTKWGKRYMDVKVYK